jgi:hypothetical protein
MGNFDDEHRGKGLPKQLGDGCYGSNERVLVAFEARVFAETEDGAVSEDGLVENLKEVDPDEKGEDDLVCLAEDAPVLFQLVS